MLLEQIKNSTFVGNSIKMKRFLGILICMVVFNSCDDGDLIMEDINFEDVNTQSCSTNDIIYKLKEKEALLLEIPQTVFVNEPTDPASPTIIDIDNATNQVVYRFYNGTIATENICNTIPPALPYVTDQWTASSGKIHIITTTIKSTNTTDNSTRITGYNHNIVFKNITFDKSSGSPQVYTTFPFGDYITEPTNALPFGFEQKVVQCPSSKLLYNRTSNEGLTIENIDPALIVNMETPLNKPRTAAIGSINNRLTYRLFSGLLTDDYFCSATVPALPATIEKWDAVSGGIIEVTTTKNGTTAYKHTIVLKNVVLKKGNSDFKLGDSFPYGDLTTSN